MKITLKDFAIILIYGAQKSGKTSCLRALVYKEAKNNNFDHCLLFSATKDKPEYDFLDDKYKYDSTDIDALKRYVNFCKELNKREIITKGLLILDDIIGTSEMHFRNDFFTNLFAMHRHYGLNIILISQTIIDIPPKLRSLVSFGCVYKFISESDIDKIHACFGSLCKTKKEFIDLYNKYTDQKYKFFCFMKTDAFNIESAYCGYKAPLIKKSFKLEL